MRRRSVLALGSAGISVAMAHALVWSQESGVRKRVRATDPFAAADLKAFSDAVLAMRKNKNATHPDSWDYWANVHGTSPGATIPSSLQGIWRTCDHGAYFLAWHRLYLIYFESVIATISGKSDFAMPYWDWYESIDLPAKFIEPEEANGLWHANRGYRKRYRVTPAVLDQVGYEAFNQNAFGDPHSPIHVNFIGDMGAPSTAARDPVFWPHHASMDRLWEKWLSLNPKNVNPKPADSWSTRQFRFLAGPNGIRAVSTVLTLSALGYEYDDMKVVAIEAASLPPRKPARSQTGTALDVGPPLEGATAMRPVGELRAARLDGTSLTVRLPFPTGAAPQLESVGSGSSASIRLSGVRLTPEGARRGVLYDIYVNLPSASRSSTVDTRQKIGQINSFGLAPHDHHGRSTGTEFSFSITTLVPLLKAAGVWNPNAVEVDLVEPAEERSRTPLITIDRIQLLLGRN